MDELAARVFGRGEELVLGIGILMFERMLKTVPSRPRSRASWAQHSSPPPPRIAADISAEWRLLERNAPPVGAHGRSGAPLHDRLHSSHSRVA
jgi:hypothetical protein